MVQQIQSRRAEQRTGEDTATTAADDDKLRIAQLAQYRMAGLATFDDVCHTDVRVQRRHRCDRCRKVLALLSFHCGPVDHEWQRDVTG